MNIRAGITIPSIAGAMNGLFPFPMKGQQGLGMGEQLAAIQHLIARALSYNSRLACRTESFDDVAAHESCRCCYDHLLRRRAHLYRLGRRPSVHTTAAQKVSDCIGIVNGIFIVGLFSILPRMFLRMTGLSETLGGGKARATPTQEYFIQALKWVLQFSFGIRSVAY